jgi:hypothetical protein
MEPFAPRHIGFHGLRTPGSWRLKLYSVQYAPGSIDWPGFAPGLSLAEAQLPQPAVTAARPGVGFLIAHQGRTSKYAVLGWWDQENELPLRVLVSPDGRRQGWRRSGDSESICVWDLEIIWAERQAYVGTILCPGVGDITAYLARIAGGSTTGGT